MDSRSPSTDAPSADICARRQGAPRAARARSTRRDEGRGAARDRRRARGAHRRDPRGQRARPGGGPRGRALGAALIDRLALDEGRVAAIARRRARDRRAARPGRRGARRLPAAQRARRAQGARAARRRRGRLRGAPERHDRRRRAVPEVRQRGRAARVLDARRTPTRCSRGGASRPSRRPACPRASLSLVAGGGREELAELAGQEGVVDLIIPRGGEGLKKALQRGRDGARDLRGVGQLPRVRRRERRSRTRAEAIVLNAKTQRPGVCNAAETLLVHEDVAAEFLPRRARRAARPRASSCAATRAVRRDRRLRVARPASPTGPRSSSRWCSRCRSSTRPRRRSSTSTRYGSGHSEAIVTRDTASARAFQLGVDAACVYVNASTRFTDGGEFGMGAEIGNSTQKLHARGPIGAARAVHVQVPGRGRRPDPALRGAVGLLGGTFNPPHIGHLVCAQEAWSQLGLDRVLLVPVHTPPHKEAADDPGAEVRLALCEAAVAGDERLGVSRAEVDVPGPRTRSIPCSRLHDARPEDRADLHRRRRHGRLAAPRGASREAILELCTTRRRRARRRRAATRSRAPRPRAARRVRPDPLLRHAPHRHLIDR